MSNKLRRDRPDLKLFRYVIAVADEKGFGKAADRLGISQPPLSQRISEFEKVLGVRLFDRLPNGAVPTAAGRVFVLQARTALQEADRAMALARSASVGEAGDICVALAGGAMFSFLPKVLRDFNHMYPGVRLSIVNLSPDEQIRRLQEGAIDVGFTRMAPTTADVGLTVVYSEAYVAALPRHLSGFDRPTLSLKELRDQPFVMFQREGSGFYLEVQALCLASGFLPSIAQEIAPMHAVLGLVDAGQGIAVVPSSAHVMAFPNVVYKALLGLENSSKLYLACHQSKRSKVCEIFIAFTKSQIGEFSV